MKNVLVQYWNGFSRREKLACVTAVSALLLYSIYVIVVESSVRETIGKRVHLARLNAEYQSLLSGHQRQDGLKDELAALGLELEGRMEKEGLLAEGARTRRPVETLLRELRKTTEKAPLQLVDMEIKTGMISKAGEFAATAVPGSAQGNSPKVTGAKRDERVDHTVSKVILKYRSSYANSVNYLVKVMDLPYAISVNTVEMERINVAGAGVGDTKRRIGGAGTPDGKMTMNTKLGIDIFYR